MLRFLRQHEDLWARGLGRVSRLWPLLAAACQIENPGFKLIDGATGVADATLGTTGTGSTGGATGSDSGSTGGSGSGSTGGSESDGGTTGAVCVAMTPCYSGRPGSQDLGPCRGGLSTCTPLGELEACEGEVVPQLDPCDTPEDEDCNGSVLGCAECLPGAVEACYSGPPGTEGVGVCISGKTTCTDKGALGPCEGEVTPMLQEICGNMLDDDCNASKDDGC